MDPLNEVSIAHFKEFDLLVLNSIFPSQDFVSLAERIAAVVGHVDDPAPADVDESDGEDLDDVLGDEPPVTGGGNEPA